MPKPQNLDGLSPEELLIKIFYQVNSCRIILTIFLSLTILVLLFTLGILK